MSRLTVTIKSACPKSFVAFVSGDSGARNGQYELSKLFEDKDREANLWEAIVWRQELVKKTLAKDKQTNIYY